MPPHGTGLDVAVDRPATGIVVLRVSGELDLATSPHLDRAIDTELTRRPSTVLVDLSDVGFVGSSGLRSLIQGQQRVLSADARFGLVAELPRQLRRLLEVSGCTGLIQHYPDLADALPAPPG